MERECLEIHLKSHMSSGFSYLTLTMKIHVNAQ